jgi:hypothetical protein
MMNRHILSALVATSVLLAVGAMCSPSTPVRGATDVPPGSDNSLNPAPPASQSDFFAEIHRTLKTQHERMIELANRRASARGDPRSLADQLVNQQIKIESAKSNFLNAQLMRQVAEMAVTEYTAGIFAMDKATADGEFRLAKHDVNQQKIMIEVLKERLARIERASNGSAIDLSITSSYSDLLINAERQERKRRLEVETAEAKIKMLVEYTKPIRIREREAELMTARADELAKKAILELEKAKEKRLAAAAGRSDTRRAPGPGPQDRIPVLLDKAISIEEKIPAKLNQVTTEGKLTSLLQNEIRELAKHLEATVDEAQAERSALLLDRLKARIHQATSQAGVPAE